MNPLRSASALDPPQAYKDRLNIEDMPLPLMEGGELDSKPPHQQKDYMQGRPGWAGGTVPDADGG